jgi:anti-sigma B factor antagonist
MPLQCSVQDHGSCAEIQLKGHALTEPEFEPLQEHLNVLLDQGQSNLIINLAGIDLLNSLGIKSLIKAFTRCRNKGGDLCIVNISPKINQVLLVTKLNTVLNIAPSVQDAVRSFNSK